MAMLRMAGLYGVMFFGLILAATLMGAPLATGPDDVALGADAPAVQRWADDPTRTTVALWLWMAAFVMLLAFTAHIVQVHGDASRDIAVAAMLLGACALVAILAAVLMFGVAREAAPYIVANALPGDHAFVRTTATLLGAVRMAYLLASFLAALGTILLGLGLLRSSAGLQRGFAVACMVFGVVAAGDVLLDMASRYATGPGALEFTVGALMAVRGGIDSVTAVRQHTQERAALRAVGASGSGAS